jgi:hypothetical protein
VLMFRPISSPMMARQRASIVLLVVLSLSVVVFPPLVGVLELHHALGDADQDGHQHSAADLCSWVSHASSSLAACTPVRASEANVVPSEYQYEDHFVPHLFLRDLPARGPPFLSRS